MADGGAPHGYLTALHARWLAERPDQPWQELDGTLLFADVSGFTVLGERLARQGRIGAEILTETVNTVFAGMLDVVDGEGGEILKFGGDAILALFTGPQHAMRGCSAGLGLQAMLRDLRRGRSVNLRLSAGVASGTAHAFLAGAAPRELIVAGPLATEVLAQEAAAEAGQVLVSAETAAALPDGCVGEPIGPGRLLRRAPATAAVAPLAPPAGFDPATGLPAHLHQHVPGDAEHRAVTVAFVQFRGTDGLLTERGQDALARALDDVVGAAAEAARGLGVTFVGTDVDQNAGKVILVAGAPAASPDDDDRMLHALNQIVGAPRALEVRAGVNRGRVFTVDIGPERRRTWTVMGDDVNLAARVMGQARPGHVLATRSVLARLRDDFAREPVPPFTVKGKKAPVFAEEVGAASGTRRSTAAAGPLVGRERELSELSEAVSDMRAGGQRVIELVGEAGIGKSRLVEALIAQLGDRPTLLVQGGPYSVNSPYRALRAPLRRLLGLAPEAPDAEVRARLEARAAEDPALLPWLPLIAIPFGLELPPSPETAALSPEFARSRLADWAIRLVRRLLPEGPVALIVEDEHWIDAASGDLLATLVRTPRPGGRLVVGTRRDVTTGIRLDELDGCRTLRIGPIGSDAARALIAEQGTLALPPGDAARIIERAGGNPLLLEELLAAARAGESIDALPDTVEALVTARMDTLPRGDRRLLREASVLGIQVSERLLGQLLEADGFAIQAALRRLTGFLVPSGPQTVRFRHALLRDAAYETLPFRRRRELHGRAARILERGAGDAVDEQAELLSLHFHAARDWGPTWRYARLAAEQAMRRAAPVEAAAFLTKALEAGRALRLDDDLAPVAERLGEAAALGGHFDLAARAYAQARDHRRGDPLAMADLCERMGRLREQTHGVSEALRWNSRGLRHLRDAPPGPEAQRLRARLTLAHGSARVRAGRLRECLPFLEAAVAEAAACDARAALGHAYYLLEATHTDLGSPENPYEGLSLPIFEELGDDWGIARALNTMGIRAYYEGRWDEAAGHYARSRDASLRLGDVVEAMIALNNSAEIRSDQGHYDEAEPMFREALQTWRGAGFRIGAGLACSNLGRLACRRGELEQSQELLRDAREQLEAIGAEFYALEAQSREAERLLRVGDDAAALRLAGEVRAGLRRIGEVPILMATLQRIAGYAKLQAGHRNDAVDRFRESLSLARSVDAAYEEALALEGLGRTGDADAAAGAEPILRRLGVLRTAPPVPLIS